VNFSVHQEVENEIKELPPNETRKGKVLVTWKEKTPKGKQKKGKRAKEKDLSQMKVKL
jgi:hypothetical protein